MVSLQGYSTAYSNLADSNIPNPLEYFTFWKVPELFDIKNINGKLKFDTDPTPLNVSKSLLQKPEKSTARESLTSQTLTNTVYDVLKSRKDLSEFYNLISMYPLVCNQLKDYSGSIFAFKNSDIKLNKYDTFQLENMARYHTSKSILPIEQIKDKKLRVTTLLDNQFIVVHSPTIPVKCTSITPGKDIDNYYNKTSLNNYTGKEGNMGKLGTWNVSKKPEEMPFVMVHSNDSRQRITNGVLYVEDLNPVYEVVQCDNGLIYVIDHPVPINYYQF